MEKSEDFKNKFSHKDNRLLQKNSHLYFCQNPLAGAKVKIMSYLEGKHNVNKSLKNLH